MPSEDLGKINGDKKNFNQSDLKSKKRKKNQRVKTFQNEDTRGKKNRTHRIASGLLKLDPITPKVNA
jgi:hypothetical protein